MNLRTKATWELRQIVKTLIYIQSFPEPIKRKCFLLWTLERLEDWKSLKLLNRFQMFISSQYINILINLKSSLNSFNMTLRGLYRPFRDLLNNKS